MQDRTVITRTTFNVAGNHLTVYRRCWSATGRTTVTMDGTSLRKSVAVSTHRSPSHTRSKRPPFSLKYILSFLWSGIGYFLACQPLCISRG